MPLRTNPIERLIFCTANLGPGPLLDLLGGLAFRAVHAGVELGLFDALEPGPLPLDQLAERLGASERGVRFLADALEPLGYLEEREGTYGLTAMSRRWMLRSSQTPLGDLFRYFDDVIEREGQLVESVRKGAPALDAPSWFDRKPGRWELYQAGMKAVSALLSDEIVARVPFPPGARDLLDLGGGHGLHAARFCRRYPELRATVLDLPEAAAAAAATARDEGLEGRLRFVAGDFLADDLGEGRDVVLLFQVLRALPPSEAERLVRRAAEALRPGGLVVVMDQLVERPGSAFVRANARLIDLELFNSSPGEVYRATRVEAWLVAAGLSSPRLVPLRRSGGQGLLLATRP